MPLRRGKSCSNGDHNNNNNKSTKGAMTKTSSSAASLLRNGGSASSAAAGSGSNNGSKKNSKLSQEEFEMIKEDALLAETVLRRTTPSLVSSSSSTTATSVTETFLGAFRGSSSKRDHIMSRISDFVDDHEDDDDDDDDEEEDEDDEDYDHDEDEDEDDDEDDEGCLHCHTVSPDVQVRCDECASYICETCHWCHEFQANHEIRVCDRCDAFYCRQCDEMDQCDDCGEVVCASCSTLLSCKFCGGGLCEECATACGRCGIVLCSRDAKFAVDCDTCRLSYCLVCLASGSKDPCVRCGHRPSKRMEQLVHLRLKSIYKAFKQSSNNGNSSSNGGSSSSTHAGKSSSSTHSAHSSTHSNSGRPRFPVTKSKNVRERQNDDPDEGYVADDPEALLQAAAAASAAKSGGGKHNHHASSSSSRHETSTASSSHSGKHARKESQNSTSTQERVEQYRAEKAKADAAAAALLAELEEEEAAAESKKMKKKKRKKGRQQIKKQEKGDNEDDPHDKSNRDEEDDDDEDYGQQRHKVTIKSSPEDRSESHNADQDEQDPDNSFHERKQPPEKQPWKDDENDTAQSKPKDTSREVKTEPSQQQQVSTTETSSSSQHQQATAALPVDPMEEELGGLIEAENVEGLERLLKSIKGVPGRALMRKNIKKVLKRLRVTTEEPEKQPSESSPQPAAEESTPNASQGAVEESAAKPTSRPVAAAVKPTPVLKQEQRHKQQQQQQREEELAKQQDATSSEPTATQTETTDTTPVVSPDLIKVISYTLNKTPSNAPRSRNTSSSALPTRSECVLHIAPHIVGWIIGRGGQRIRDLMDESGARIWIDHDGSGNTETRLLFVSGSRKSVDTGVNLVMDLVARTPPTPLTARRDGTGSGDSDAKGGPGTPGEPSERATSSSAVDLKHRTAGLSSSSDHSMLRSSSHHHSHHHHHHVDRVKQVLTCDPRFVPLLIGRRGWTIKNIQDTTGARVDIDQTVNPRRITVMGAEEDVQKAVRMVRDVLSYPQSQLQGAVEPISTEATTQPEEEIKHPEMTKLPVQSDPVHLSETVPAATMPETATDMAKEVIASPTAVSAAEDDFDNDIALSPLPTTTPFETARVPVAAHTPPPSSLIMTGDDASASSSLSSTPEPSMASSARGNFAPVAPNPLLPSMRETAQPFQNPSGMRHAPFSQQLPPRVPIPGAQILPSGGPGMVGPPPSDQFFAHPSPGFVPPPHPPQPGVPMGVQGSLQTDTYSGYGSLPGSHLNPMSMHHQSAFQRSQPPPVQQLSLQGSNHEPRNGLMDPFGNPVRDGAPVGLWEQPTSQLPPQQHHTQHPAPPSIHSLHANANAASEAFRLDAAVDFLRNSQNPPPPPRSMVDDLAGILAPKESAPVAIGLEALNGSLANSGRDESRMVDSLFGPRDSSSVGNILSSLHGLSLDSDSGAQELWGLSHVAETGLDLPVDTKAGSPLFDAFRPPLTASDQTEGHSRFIWGGTGEASF